MMGKDVIPPGMDLTDHTDHATIRYRCLGIVGTERYDRLLEKTIVLSQYSSKPTLVNLMFTYTVLEESMRKICGVVK